MECQTPVLLLLAKLQHDLRRPCVRAVAAARPDAPDALRIAADIAL